jgi:hypothetical protein
MVTIDQGKEGNTAPYFKNTIVRDWIYCPAVIRKMYTPLAHPLASHITSYLPGSFLSAINSFTSLPSRLRVELALVIVGWVHLLLQSLLNRVRTRASALLQKQQAFCMREVPRLQTVEVHPTRKVCAVKLHFVNSRIQPLIHEHGHLTTEHIEDAQPHYRGL